MSIDYGLERGLRLAFFCESFLINDKFTYSM